MKTTDRNALIAFPIIVLLGAGMALVGSQGGLQWGGWPVFALAVGWIFLVQWLAFIPAFGLQTEKFFDLTGSLTYISVVGLALLGRGGLDIRSALLAALVVIWAGRLGTFLFTRIRRAGKDDRFDAIKPSFIRFLNVWTIQALWVTMTVAAALVGLTAPTRPGWEPWAVVGGLVWLLGFVVEVVADAQKSRFNANPANRGQFIRSGLWARSRHPNYLGEIILWVGIALIAVPVLQGWQWVALISPVFVTVLLTRVSGIPLLEKKADVKWGGQVEYETYKQNTPVLFPRW